MWKIVNYNLNGFIKGCLMSKLETVGEVAENDGFKAQRTTAGTAEDHQSLVVSDSTTNGMNVLS